MILFFSCEILFFSFFKRHTATRVSRRHFESVPVYFLNICSKREGEGFPHRLNGNGLFSFSTVQPTLWWAQRSSRHSYFLVCNYTTTIFSFIRKSAVSAVGYFSSLCVEQFSLSFEGSRAAAVNLVSKRSPSRFQGKAFYPEKSYLFPTTRGGAFSETSPLSILL